MNLLKKIFGKKEDEQEFTIGPGFIEGGIYEVKGYGKLIARPLENSSGWVLNSLKVDSNEAEKTLFILDPVVKTTKREK